MAVIRINFTGKESFLIQVPDGSSLEDIMGALGYDPGVYFARLGNNYIPNDHSLVEGDEIDIFLVRDDAQGPSYLRSLLALNISTSVSHNSCTAAAPVYKRQTKLCDTCGKPAIHVQRFAVNLRRQARVYRCAECLIKEVERKGLSVLLWHDMIRPDDRVLVPLSGGKDSALALYLIMKFIERSGVPCEVFAYTVRMGVGNQYFDRSVSTAVELSNKLGVGHVILDMKEYYGRYLDQIVAERSQLGEPFWGPCILCSVVRSALQRLLVRSLKITKTIASYTLTDQLSHLLWGMFLQSRWRERAMPVYHDPVAGVTTIQPLFEVDELEVALSTHILGLPVLRHFECECPFAAGGRFAQTNIVHRIEAFIPGILLQKRKDILGYLETNKSMEEVISCRSCGSAGVLKGDDDTCLVCSVHRQYGLEVPRAIE